MSTPQVAPSQSPLGKNFEMRIGQVMQIAGETVTLTFERVAEDSRCPTNVKCIWEGDAVVRLTVQGQNSERGTLNLHTQVNASREAVFQAYRVRLVQLAPYPKDAGSIPADSYVATIVVTRSS